MNLLGLRYFIAVAEYKSFTKASEHIFVTQPTLSRQVQDLEAEFGVSLFVRGRQSLVLTEQGTRFLQEAKAIIKRCDNIPNVIKSESVIENEEYELLNIGYQGFLDSSFMNMALKKLNQNYPDTEEFLFRGSIPELRHNLLIGKCDVVFALSSCFDGLPYLEVIEIQKNKMQIAVPENHRLAKNKSVNIADLANEGFVMLERQTSPLTVDYAISLCMKNGFSPNASCYASDAEKAYLLVSSGKGIAFIHSMYKINDHDNIVGIKLLDIEGNNDDFDYCLAYKKDNKNSSIPLLVSEGTKA